MKLAVLLLVLVPFLSLSQNGQYKFISDYQLDKTYNGSKVEGNRKATITFNDPKPSTKEGTAFENLPKGYMIVKYDGLNPVKEEIIYIGKNKSNNDIYTITSSQTGNDIIYLMKGVHKAKNKTYNYVVLWGTADENNYGGLPKYFTAFHCNLTK